MKTFAPSYYKNFLCKASECRHSCCIGWEIDIDENTAGMYASMGEKFSRFIEYSKDGAHFIIDENERCPFLETSGLCRIITEYGEDYLCNICADHPRFRNYSPSRAEIGLGMCCEAAAGLILRSENPFTLIEVDDDGENEIQPEEETEFFEFRSRIFNMLSDKDIPPLTALLRVLDLCGAKMPEISCHTAAELCFSLEKLDDSRDYYLSLIDQSGSSLFSSEIKNFEENFRRLSEYFFFRHMNYDAYYESRADSALFCAFSVFVIASAFSEIPDKAADTLEEICRVYSSEIEYSDENPYIIIDSLNDLIW